MTSTIPSGTSNPIRDLTNQFKQLLAEREANASDVILTHYGTAWRSIYKQLTDLTAAVEEAKRSGTEVSPSWLYNQTRYRSLLKGIRETIAHFADAAHEETRQAQADAVHAGYSDSNALIAARMGPPPESATPADVAKITTAFGDVPSKVIDTTLGNIQSDNAVGQLFDSFGETAASEAKSALVDAVMQGKNGREIAGTVADALSASLRRAETIARTELNRSYRQATYDNYQANSDVVNGYVWIADLSTNTCGECWAMNGQVFEFGEEPDSHPNCRCALAPMTQSWADLGFDMGDEADYEEEDIPTGEDVFAQLPEQQQAKILGPSKNALYQTGQIQLSDLVGYKHDATWGGMRYEKSLTELGFTPRDVGKALQQVEQGKAVRAHPLVRDYVDLIGGEIPPEVARALRQLAEAFPDAMDTLRAQLPGTTGLTLEEAQRRQDEAQANYEKLRLELGAKKIIDLPPHPTVISDFKGFDGQPLIGAIPSKVFSGMSEYLEVRAAILKLWDAQALADAAATGQLPAEAHAKVLLKLLDAFAQEHPDLAASKDMKALRAELLAQGGQVRALKAATSATPAKQLPKKIEVNYWDAKSRAAIKDVFGRTLRAPEIAALVGAQSDAVVNVRALKQHTYSLTFDYPKESKAIEIEAYDNANRYDMARQLIVLPDGTRVMVNGNIDVRAQEQGKGLGTKLFSDEVRALQANGFSRIDSSLERMGQRNGYYTWARLGYDGPIPLDKLAEVGRNLPDIWAGYTRISEIMATPEGRAWWKENGIGWEGSFDLTPGSYSIRTLDAYLKDKGMEPITSTKPTVPTVKPPTEFEPAPLEARIRDALANPAKTTLAALKALATEAGITPGRTKAATIEALRARAQESSVAKPSPELLKEAKDSPAVGAKFIAEKDVATWTAKNSPDVPSIAYHGTASQEDYQAMITQGVDVSESVRRSLERGFVRGFYMTGAPLTSEGAGVMREAYGSNYVRVAVHMEHPLVLTLEEWESLVPKIVKMVPNGPYRARHGTDEKFWTEYQAALKKYLADNGYDGVIREILGSTTGNPLYDREIIAFLPDTVRVIDDAKATPLEKPAKESAPAGPMTRAELQKLPLSQLKAMAQRVQAETAPGTKPEHWGKKAALIDYITASETPPADIRAFARSAAAPPPDYEAQRADATARLKAMQDVLAKKQTELAGIRSQRDAAWKALTDRFGQNGALIITPDITAQPDYQRLRAEYDNYAVAEQAAQHDFLLAQRDANQVSYELNALAIQQAADAITIDRTALAQAKTTPELVQWLRDSIPQADWKFGGNPNPAVMRAAAEQWATLAEHYPEAMAALRFVGLTTDGTIDPKIKDFIGGAKQGDAWGGSTFRFSSVPGYAGMDGAGIVLPGADWRDPTNWLKEAKVAVQRGDWQQGAVDGGQAYIITHEFGHVLEYYVEHSPDPAVRAKYNALITKLNGDRANAFDDYAKYNAHEYFAEAFAALYYGDATLQQHSAVQQVRAFLDDVFNREPGTTETRAGTTQQVALEPPGKPDTAPRQLNILGAGKGEEVAQKHEANIEELKQQLEDARAAFQVVNANPDATMEDFSAARAKVLEVVKTIAKEQGLAAYARGTILANVQIDAASHAAANKLIGRDLSTQDLAKLAGAQPGDTVWYSASKAGNVLTVTVQGEGTFHSAKIQRIGGELVLKHDLLHVEAGNRSATTGAGILRGLQDLREFGIAKVMAHAGYGDMGNGTGEQYTGYYTWARLGFTGDIPLDRLSPDVLADMRAKFKYLILRIETLMALPGGPVWWKKNGIDWDATFDMRPGQPGALALDRLLKSAQGGTDDNAGE